LALGMRVKKTGTKSHPQICDSCALSAIFHRENSIIVKGFWRSSMPLGIERFPESCLGTAVLRRGNFFIFKISGNGHFRSETFLGEITGFSRGTGELDFFQSVFICINASVNWAPYGTALPDPGSGFILPPFSPRGRR